MFSVFLSLALIDRFGSRKGAETCNECQRERYERSDLPEGIPTGQRRKNHNNRQRTMWVDGDIGDNNLGRSYSTFAKEQLILPSSRHDR